MMKITTVAAAVAMTLVAFGAQAQAKNCEELQAEIAAKIDANGVPVYRLSIVDADAAHEGRVVGSCGGNTKRIVYVRGAGATATPAPAPEATEAPQPEATPVADAEPAAMPAAE